MGASNSKVRDRVAASPSVEVLDLSDLQLQSWTDTYRGLREATGTKELALGGNRLRRQMPAEFVRLRLWATLTTLDLSGNDLRCACVLGTVTGSHTCGRRGQKGGGGGAGDSGADASSLASSARSSSGSGSGASFVSDGYCLEVLNLSANSLAQLPPGLCQRLPALHTLICRGNQTPMILPGGLVGAIGDSASLTSIDFSDCRFRAFPLVDHTTARLPSAPVAAAAAASSHIVTLFPALEEVALDGNHFSNVFAIARTDPPHSNAAVFRFPSLHRVSLARPQRPDLLQAVDPTLYVNAPALAALELAGNVNEKTINLRLRATPQYQEWAASSGNRPRQRKRTGEKTKAALPPAGASRPGDAASPTGRTN